MKTAWREELQAQVEWPAEIQVDNKAAISFQGATSASTKLKGAIDLRQKWVKELQDAGKVQAVKVDTKRNLADMMTKCLRAPVRQALFDVLDDKVDLIADAYKCTI